MRIVWDKGEEPTSWHDLGERDGDYPVKEMLQIYRERWESGDPLAPIEAITVCYDAKIRPPDWLLGYLGERFAEYMDSCGEERLDVVFSTTSPGPGRAPLLKERSREYQNSNRSYTMSVLVEIFGIPIGDASFAVARKIEENGERAPDPSWLEQQYRRNWRKNLPSDYLALFVEFGSADKFLSNFPQDVQDLIRPYIQGK